MTTSDTMLQDLRELAKLVLHGELNTERFATPQEQAEALAEGFEALDELLSERHVMPNPWRPARPEFFKVAEDEDDEGFEKTT